MKKTTTLLLATLLGLAACQHESFDERCGREAREYTEKQCPRRMDDYTMMDSLTFDRASRTLTYYYTMEGMLDTDSMATPEFGEARRLLKFLNNFQAVAADEIPPTSLLREFIGGSSFRY